jgi:uncharacterized protein YaiL (DUF2058 family)
VLVFRVLKKVVRVLKKSAKYLKKRNGLCRSYLLHELSHLRSLLTAAREKLAVEKESADSLAGEHFKLSQGLRRALDQEAAVRRATAAKLSSAGAALASDHAASLRRLEALHKIELERAKATAVATREKDQLERDRLVDFTKRLRSERNQARADSLRYNEERNALRREDAEFHVRQYEAAVCDATRIRLAFPGTRAE